MKSKHVCQVVNHYLSQIKQQKAGIYEAFFHAEHGPAQLQLEQEYLLLQEIEAGMKVIRWHHGDVKTKSCSASKVRRLHADFMREVAFLFMSLTDSPEQHEQLERLDRVWKFISGAEQQVTHREGFSTLDELIEGSSQSGDVEDIMNITDPVPDNVTHI